MTIKKLYADGGVIERNPSIHGGTWAWIAVDENDTQVCFESGVITAAEMRLGGPVTNNQTELLALIYGLEHLPADFSGTIFSDSNNSLGRLFCGWKWKNIPMWMHERYRAARKRLVHWEDAITFTLLDGHPTKAQLLAGIGKRGHPVSEFNVQCDKLCGEAAEKFLRAPRPVDPQQMAFQDELLRPAVNTALAGNGVVVAHERVKDSLGQYHGLNKLIVQGETYYPEIDLWKKMLPDGAAICRVDFDPAMKFKSIIFYKVTNVNDPSAG